MNREFIEFLKERNKIKKYNDDGTFNKNFNIEFKNSIIEMKEKFSNEIYKYGEYLNEFIDYISQFDKLEVLSYFSFLRIYEERKGKEDDSLNIFQLEFLQYILISICRNEKKELLTQEHVERIKEFLLVLPEVINLDLSEYEGRTNNEKKELNIVHEIILERSFIRNCTTPNIENNINEELLKKLDKISINKYGVKYSLIMKMFMDILANMNKKIKNYIETIFDSSLNQIASDICNICTFSIEEFLASYEETVIPIAIEKILNKFSYSLTNKIDINPKEIFINNPIWNKFLIKIDDKKYFFPPIDSFISRVLEIFRNLIVEDDETKKQYDDIKGEFLEQKIVEIFTNKFKKLIYITIVI